MGLNFGFFYEISGVIALVQSRAVPTSIMECAKLKLTIYLTTGNLAACATSPIAFFEHTRWTFEIVLPAEGLHK